MISFGEKNKRLYIRVLLTSVSQAKIEKFQLLVFFWLMYTMKTTIIYNNEKLLLFDCGRFHEEGKRVMVSFETTNIKRSNNVFLTYIAQEKHEKFQ